MTVPRMVAGSMALGLAMAAGLAGQASAQTISSPQTIAECLCMEQQLENQGAVLTTLRREYEATRDEVLRLDREVEQGRPMVDAQNSASVEEFRRLLHQTEEARAQFNNDLVPRYNTAVASYSATVSRYKAQCDGKLYDGTVLQAIRSNLNCQRP